MSMIRTNNPVLNTQAFEQSVFGNLERDAARPKVMTIQGAVNASFILLGISVAAAVTCWTLFQSNPEWLYLGTFGGSILGLVLTMVCTFKRQWSPYVAMPIALAEGVLAGGLSVMWSAYAQGVHTKSGIVEGLGTGLVLQASLLTVGIAGGMLIAYTTRLVRATEKFKMGVYAATMGICFVSIVSMVLGMFGVHIPYLWENGIIGIGFAGFIVVIAALNLVLDFDIIEQGAANSAPKYMEWYSAIGLLVTLVWLYVSILRLLAMLSNRR